MATRRFAAGPVAGDGLVVCGEDRYWPGIVVAVRLLRACGSDLPVQVWHNGPIGRELDDAPGVTLVDAAAVRWAHPARILRGWEMKTYAILHSGFRRVLFLDADAYCVADPRPLFDILDDVPFAYWEDLPRCWHNVHWLWYGIAGNHVPPVQGGQLLIDVEQFSREAMLAHWINQHSDYFYRHQFGDQDSCRDGPGSPRHRPGPMGAPGIRLRLAWRRLHRPSLPGKALPGSVAPAMGRIAARGGGVWHLPRAVPEGSPRRTRAGKDQSTGRAAASAGTLRAMN
jgi:hypothetical protein